MPGISACSGEMDFFAPDHYITIWSKYSDQWPLTFLFAYVSSYFEGVRLEDRLDSSLETNLPIRAVYVKIFFIWSDCAFQWLIEAQVWAGAALP